MTLGKKIELDDLEKYEFYEFDDRKREEMEAKASKRWFRGKQALAKPGFGLILGLKYETLALGKKVDDSSEMWCVWIWGEKKLRKP